MTRNVLHSGASTMMAHGHMMLCSTPKCASCGLKHEPGRRKHDSLPKRLLYRGCTTSFGGGELGTAEKKGHEVPRSLTVWAG